MPEVMPNQGASMAKLIEAKLHGSLDLLQIYTGNARWHLNRKDFYDRHAEPFVFAYARTARNFERNPLLPSDAYTRAGGAKLHDLGGRCDLLGFGRDELVQYVGADLRALGRGRIVRCTSAPFSRLASLGVGKCTRRGKSSMILSG